MIDDIVAGVYYTDADGDGFGRSGAALQMCFPTGAVSAKNTDCNDREPLIHPGQFELKNGVDDNCNGAVDESPNLSTQ